MNVAAVALSVVALGPGAETETVTAGPVTAELSYEVVGDVRFRGLRVAIARDGETVYRRSLYDDECREDGCHPAYRPKWTARDRSIALRDLDRDAEPEVIVDLRLGGAHDRCYTVFHRYAPPSYEPLAFAFDEPCYDLRDLDRSAPPVPEIVGSDTRFTPRFSSSTVGYVRPLRIWRYQAGRLVDVTRAFPQQVRRDRDRLWRSYRRSRSGPVESLGLLAAWAADEYLLGRRREALRVLRRLRREGWLSKRRAGWRVPTGRRYIRELDRYLLRRGYG